MDEELQRPNFIRKKVTQSKKFQTNNIKNEYHDPN